MVVGTAGTVCTRRKPVRTAMEFVVNVEGKDHDEVPPEPEAFTCHEYAVPEIRVPAAIV